MGAPWGMGSIPALTGERQDTLDESPVHHGHVQDQEQSVEENRSDGATAPGGSSLLSSV